MSTTQETVSFNGREYDEETFATATRVAINTVEGGSASRIQTRSNYLDNLGKQYHGDRDIYDVLGYPDQIEIDDYRAKYERDFGKRLVEMPAVDSWQKKPVITDSPDDEGTSSFDTAVRQLEQAVKPWHYARRTDTVAGIGHYGVWFIGFTDSASLDEPVDASSLPSDPSDVISHFEPFAQDSVDDWTLGKNSDEDVGPNEREYNRPVSYYLDFGDVDAEEADDPHWVHHTRVVHVPSDGRDESDILGTPRLKDVYNRLIDLEKIVGSSAEMFWTGAAPRYQFDVKAENSADVPDDELEKLDEEVQKLVHDMQNYIKTFNTDVEVISGEEVDPSGVFDTIVGSIAGTKGIPQRVLSGSERGELASSQDRANWLSTCDTRRRQFNEPTIVRVFIDRLRKFDALPRPSDDTYTVIWPNLFELNEVEESEVQVNRSEVIANLAPKGNTDLLGEFDELMDYIIDGEKPEFVDEPLPRLPEDNSQVQRQFGGSSDGIQ